MSNFAPPISPSFESNSSVTKAVLIAPFGDGYTQRVGDGINTTREQVRVFWGILTTTQLESIIGFLEERGGYEAFAYRLPWRNISQMWSCREWEVTPLDGDVNDLGEGEVLSSLSALFRLEFDPVVTKTILVAGTIGDAADTTIVVAPGSTVRLTVN